MAVCNRVAREAYASGRCDGGVAARSSTTASHPPYSPVAVVPLASTATVSPPLRRVKVCAGWVGYCLLDGGTLPCMRMYVTMLP